MRNTLAALSILAFLIAVFSLNSSYVRSDPTLNVSNYTADAGNTTALNFDAAQLTATWQGFFGTVTGGIYLSNAGGNKFYDWSQVTASGEVFASRSVVTDWSLVNCTNQTEIYQEEERLGITNLSTDGINDTYLNTTHPSFQVAGRLMVNCRSTLTDNSTDQKVVFWNIILNTNASTTIYASIMQNDVIGFNGTPVDYQLLVPVNRTSGTSQYNFYLDLN